MDSETRVEYEGKSQALRQELKLWENAWAQSNNGKKPGRADIKANEDIGMETSSYNQRKTLNEVLII